MIINAKVLVKNIGKNKQRVEVRSPKYPRGKMLFSLPISDKNKEIKFFTDKKDLVGCPDKLSLGQIIRSDNVIYIFTSEILIK